MTAVSFVTFDGVVVPAVSADEMREVDRIAIEETGPNLYQMMENAGRNLALTAIEMLGHDWRRSSIVVLAGTGGNGGGGICAARHLANRGVDIILVITDQKRLGEVSAKQLEVYEATSGRLAKTGDLDSFSPSLVVDAVIGYSLSGLPKDTALDLIMWSAAFIGPILSLDVPSGVDSTTGETPGAHVSPTKTMTLALPKTGLDVESAGSLVLADIGIPTAVYQRAGIEVPANLFGSQYMVAIAPR